MDLNDKNIIAAFEAYRASRIRLMALLGPADSQRDPLTEFGEWLVARLVGGRLAESRTQPGHDVIGPTRERIQVRTLSNPARYDRNSVIVEFKEGVDRFAVVFYEDFRPQVVTIFRTGSFRELNRILGNRPTKADPEVKLSLSLRHVVIFRTNPEMFATRGVSVYHPDGDRICQGCSSS
jgi:hypothetical protein